MRDYSDPLYKQHTTKNQTVFEHLNVTSPTKLTWRPHDIVQFVTTQSNVGSIKKLEALHTVKCNFVQALRFCTGRKAHGGSSGIALPFHDHGTRRG